VKPVLAWVKSNPLIVVFGALILILLPASWFVSSWWSNKIKTTQEKQAGDELRKLQAAGKVDYVLKTYEPGAATVSFKEVPNKALIKWFKDQGQTLADQAGSLVKRAEDFNKGVGPEAAAVGRSEHRPLVEGLFPAAASKDEESARLNEFEDAVLGQRGRPNPYQQMLDNARAGGPADAVRLVETINDMESREKEKITANKRDLTADERAALNKQLADARLAQYQSRVSSISVYATMDSLPHEKGSGGIPTGTHLDAPVIDTVHFFGYQWDLWVMQDLFAAVKLANMTPGGKQTNVDTSVVKRVISIEIDPPDGMGPREEREGGGMPAAAQPLGGAPASSPGMVPLDLGASVTGRVAGPGNSVYDIRRARITVVVSSARLQEFLEAIARTNFMTVIDLDLTDVNSWEDLRKGYYYGPEHVVKATVGIETVWLRSWMAAYMPSKLKQAMQIPEPPPEAGAAPAAMPLVPASPGGPGPRRGPG
jgi:hypothetical protein